MLRRIAYAFFKDRGANEADDGRVSVATMLEYGVLDIFGRQFYIYAFLCICIIFVLCFD